MGYPCSLICLRFAGVQGASKLFADLPWTPFFVNQAWRVPLFVLAIPLYNSFVLLDLRQHPQVHVVFIRS